MYHEFRNNSNKDGQKTSCPEDLKMTEVNLFVFKDRVLLYVIFVGQELTMCIRPALISQRSTCLFLKCLD